MEARYLRVKNWHKHQHYKERRPPWIKLQRDLVNGDDGRDFREELTELEQWQLVRIWLYVSGSERVMIVDDREVPLIAYDEQTIRLGIRSAKRVPVDKFVRLGFLEPVSAAEVDACTPASTDASATASTASSIEPPESAVTTPTEEQRFRGSEVNPTEPVGDESTGNVQSLDSLRAAAALFEAIPECDRDEGTQRIVLGYASQLQPVVFDEIRRHMERKLATDSLFKSAGAYVNGALQKAARPKRQKEAAA